MKIQYKYTIKNNKKLTKWMDGVLYYSCWTLVMMNDLRSFGQSEWMKYDVVIFKKYILGMSNDN